MEVPELVFFWRRDGLVEKVAMVSRVNERGSVLRIMVGRIVLNLISVYASHVERSMEEKDEFHICLGRILTSVRAEERVVAVI